MDYVKCDPPKMSLSFGPTVDSEYSFSSSDNKKTPSKILTSSAFSIASASLNDQTQEIAIGMERCVNCITLVTINNIDYLAVGIFKANIQFYSLNN